MNYPEKLRDGRWCLKRENLFEQRGYVCQACGGTKSLTIHHGYYRFNTDPWDYEDDTLWILCWPCHERVQNELAAIHQAIGRIHPNELVSLQKKLGDEEFFKLIYEVTYTEACEILEIERQAANSLYSDYTISISSSQELGPSQVSEIEIAATARFPGANVAIFPSNSERDAISNVQGPNEEVRSKIQKWCNRWNG